MKELFNEIEAKFLEALEEKNSWGKNEAKQLYIKISQQVYLEHLDKTYSAKHQN